ncbi:hypothetical protein ITQ94_05370 [Pediococcus pentosaceus]|uniref:glycoside hydrolase family 113 n=1 Tax=Pediococcus pentosaceus TaxID=1255 RepID=UPI0018FEAAED|nr:hypothetical protein [Pediococcus pentosaceus]MBF7130895.1 hypothetical protein [Pediococcus pentosaceus]
MAITTIVMDVYKPGSELKNKVVDISDSFNARVGDNQVRLVIKYIERGIVERMEQEQLTPFMMGWVGQQDEEQKVTAETGIAVSYHGSTNDIIGGGKVRMDLPGTMFPQEGAFYGFFGLENSSGKRVTTNNVLFRIENNNPDMYVDTLPFRTELQKLLDEAIAKSKTTFGDISEGWETLKKEIEDALANGNTNIDTYLIRLKSAEEKLEQYEKDLAAGKAMTQQDFDNWKTILEGKMDAVEHQDILSYRNKLKYKTISATIYSDAESISNDQLNHIQATGADLTLVTMVTVDNATDSSPTDINETTFNDVINRATKIGLNVGMLKPHIGIAGQHDSFGRDKYDPDNYDTFFENWKDLMLHYADLANTNGIPILSIGCEMKLCTDTKYLVKWQDIYNSIKAKYPDLLIAYSMSMYEFEDSENSGQISSVVDLIGLNVYPAYAPANYDATMEVDELKGAWWHDWNGHEFMQSINGYYDSYQKPIYITETGLTPYDDGLSRLVSDYNGTDHAYNFDAQAIGYKAAFEAVALNSHIIGVAIWHASKPFSFIDENNVNKVTPSEKVLTQYFKGGKI